MDYGCQLHSLPSPWRLKNFDSINRESISIYTGKPTKIHIRKLEQGYIKEQKEKSGRKPSSIATPWLINNVHFNYDGNLPANNDNEKKQHFLQHKEKHKNTKEAYILGKKHGEGRYALHWYTQILS